MPTTFNVISLGNLADMDTTEGNTVAENASALVGLTFGGVGNAIWKDFVTFSPGTGSYFGGTGTAYDQDNSPAENFRIDGGPNQVFDGTSIFNATVTYNDGTTDTVTAVIFQDTAGNTYWAPEFTANQDMTEMESKPILSLTLNSLFGNSYSGMTGNRQAWDFLVCFASGTRIETPIGAVAVDDLSIGDLVMTKDRGACPIRWIGRRTVRATGTFAPVRIRTGALGQAAPERDLVVSQQHRVMLSSKIAERLVGSREVLVAAKKLVGCEGVSLVEDMHEVTYHHILLDTHEIIFADGLATESLLAGPMALASFNAETLGEIRTLFPDFEDKANVPARQIVSGKPLKVLLARHEKNARDFVVAT